MRAELFINPESVGANSLDLLKYMSDIFGDIGARIYVRSSVWVEDALMEQATIIRKRHGYKIDCDIVADALASEAPNIIIPANYSIVSPVLHYTTGANLYAYGYKICKGLEKLETNFNNFDTLRISTNEVPKIRT